MRFRPALTLIEILLVMALISILSASAYFLSSMFRTRQALTSSADDLVTGLRRAHVFSRESKDDRDWGIKQKSIDSYTLISRDAVTTDEVLQYSLHEPTEFVNSGFEVWFDQGTGETANNLTVELKSPKGEIKIIVVNKNGSSLVQ